MVFTSLSSIFGLGFNTLIGLMPLRSVIDSPNLPLPPLVPAVHSFQPSPGSFQLPNSLSVYVDQNFVMSTRDNGLTLIPPPLLSFAETFAADLRELFPASSARVYVASEFSVHSQRDYVFLTLSSEPNHTLADGAPTTEGYAMDIAAHGVTIRGSGSKGVFWATRTLLQGLVLGDGRFPNGRISDQPDWETRGIMLGQSTIRQPCCRLLVSRNANGNITPYLARRRRTALVPHFLPQGRVCIRLVVQTERVCQYEFRLSSRCPHSLSRPFPPRTPADRPVLRCSMCTSRTTSTHRAIRTRTRASACAPKIQSSRASRRTRTRRTRARRSRTSSRRVPHGA